MRKTLAKWLVVGALAGFGLVIGAEVAAAQEPTPTPDATVQNDNTAQESESGSGDASGSNDANAESGPQAQSSDDGAEGSDFEGDTSATIAQEGDNEAEVNQEGEANSGDAVAGSQVSGVVSEGGSTSVTGSNTSEDAEAESGDATVSNSANVNVGPQTSGSNAGTAADFEDSVDATIVQEGDNAADVSQSGTSNTGDAVAGGQINGIVGAGDISVDNTNVAEDPEAETGDSEVDNAVAVDAGPFTSGDAVPTSTATGTSGGSATAGSTGAFPSVSGGSAVLPSTPARSADFEGPVTARIAQEGDNSVDASQAAESNSGDAVAGGQVTGLVAEEAGSISVVNQQASEDADAESGESNSSNAFAAPVTAGPATTGTATSGGGAGASDFEGDVDATIVQEGDNDVTTAQDAEANTGDAVAGGQVVGLVAEGGSSDIVLSNVSEDAEATSGESEAVNFNGVAAAGPIAGGAAPTGTAAGPVGASDFEGNVSAVVAQEGDNSVDSDQASEAASGDAVAGGQVVGAVTSDGGDVAIDASNVSEDDEANSGESISANAAGALLAGPINVGGVTGTAGASDFEDDVTDVRVAQEGDNDVTNNQDSETASGDAVAGGQVFGVVAAGDVDIVASNTSEDADGESGESAAFNANAATLAGPINVGGVTGTAGASDFEGAVDGAAIAQEGDNDAETNQSSESASGDAVAGGQVFGVVTEEGGSVAIDATNTSEDADAASGESAADSDVGATLAGPINVGGVTGTATSTAGASDFEGDVSGVGIAQEGDNSAGANQSSESASGDAVAGGQVFGVVASGSVDIVASNTSEDADAESGESAADSDVGATLAGPINVGGVTGTATSTAGTSDFEGDVSNVGIAQEGDNDASNNQSADAASGDAVAGGQVFGVVSSGAVAIDATNVSEDDEAESGSAVADNDVFATIAGPINVGGVTGTAGASDFEGSVAGAGIAQEGDNDLETDQSANAASGDAVGGGQVFGVVAAGSVDIVASNTSEDADAESGDADSDNAVFTALAGPINLGAGVTGTAGTSDFEGDVAGADIAQEGDNSLDLGQNVGTDSGDAVAGGQIFGVVTEAGGDVAIDATSTSEDADSESGDADGSNSVFAALVGPLDFGATGTAGSSDFEQDVSDVTLAQEGDNDLSASQSLSIDSGDAVSGGQVMGVVASGSVDIVQSNTSEDDESETGTGSGSNAVGFAQIGPFVGPTLFSGGFGAFIA